MRPAFTALVGAAVPAAMLLAVACGTRGTPTKADDKGAHETSSATVTSAALAPKASCDMVASLGTCNEYRSGTTFGLERSMCDGFKGKFTLASSGAALCPEQGRIGRCELAGGEVKRYYAALSRADARADCESDLVRGTFTSE